eukprot:1874408-Rhodomonas_salina.1
MRLSLSMLAVFCALSMPSLAAAASELVCFSTIGPLIRTEGTKRSRCSWRSADSWKAQFSVDGLTEVRVNLAPGLDVTTLQETGWGWAQNENKYGNMVWPGAKAVSKTLVKLDLKGKRVLELGAGTGLCSIAAASLGASVLATDLNEEPLLLLQEAARRQNLQVEIQKFDILGSQPLPKCDVVLAADCIYNEQLGRGMAQRVLEAKKKGATVVVGSSVKRPGYVTFLKDLESQGFGKEAFVSCDRIRDFSSPLIILDAWRGNSVQEVIQL